MIQSSQHLAAKVGSCCHIFKVFKSNNTWHRSCSQRAGCPLTEWHGTVVICGLCTVFSSWTCWKITAPPSSAVGLEPHDRTVTSGMRVEVMLRAGSWLALTKILQNFLNLSFLAALTLRSYILCALATRWTRATRPALQFIWGINKVLRARDFGVCY